MVMLACDVVAGAAATFPVVVEEVVVVAPVVAGVVVTGALQANSPVNSDAWPKKFSSKRGSLSSASTGGGATNWTPMACSMVCWGAFNVEVPSTSTLSVY